MKKTFLHSNSPPRPDHGFCRLPDGLCRHWGGLPARMRREMPDRGRARRLRSNRGLVPLFILLCTGFFSMGFWAADQGRQVTAIRMSLNHKAHKEETRPAAAGSARGRAGRTAYRATVQDVSPHMFAAPDSTGREQAPPPGLLALADGAVRIAGLTGDSAPARLREHVDRIPNGPDPEDFASFLSGGPESRSSLSHPDGGLEEAARECRVPPALFADGLTRIMSRLGIPPAALPDRRFSRYQTAVEENARRYNLSASLIYAIMRVESAFNPFAVSNAGALGLMQLIPDTAGLEAHSYITGKAENPTQSLLFDPQHNIRYGSAYLHLLHTRYFPGILNPASKELCVIAAYNGGPGAVLRVFDQNRDSALAAINALTPAQVYERLTRDMPTDQSRRYVDKVLGYLRGARGEG